MGGVGGAAAGGAARRVGRRGGGRARGSRQGRATRRAGAAGDAPSQRVLALRAARESARRRARGRRGRARLLHPLEHLPIGREARRRRRRPRRRRRARVAPGARRPGDAEQEGGRQRRLGIGGEGGELPAGGDVHVVVGGRRGRRAAGVVRVLQGEEKLGVGQVLRHLEHDRVHLLGIRIRVITVLVGEREHHVARARARAPRRRGGKRLPEAGVRRARQPLEFSPLV